MCGLVGWVGKDAASRRDDVARARDHMRQRGPDDAGLWADARACLGFRRLAILDLSPAGHQPMLGARDSVALVFNGEIYNFAELRRELEPVFAFRSHSDTEVLLHGYQAWGWYGLLARIDGMFAIALWDAAQGTLHLTRDRFGKKPLFFAQTPGGLAFASTLEALRALQPLDAVNPRALDAYLVYHAVPAPLSFFAGIHALQPAHSATYQVATAQLIVTRYWDVVVRPLERMDEREALDRMDALLRAAVRRRLVADVPVGAFLSGGVDSGLVTAMMAQEGKVETVTLGFAETHFDERSYARKVAERWGLVRHEIVLDVDTVVRDLPRMLWQCGQPHADMSVVPTFAVAAEARRHFTVVLNGDGGDEVFAGYARPLLARAAQNYRGLAPRPVRKMLGGLPLPSSGRLRKLGLLLAAGRGTALDSAVYERGLRAERREAYGPAIWAEVGNDDPDAVYRAAWSHLPEADDAERALYMELTTYLPNQLLSKMDSATMAHSLEARSPLLDRALVEFGMRLPPELRMKRFRTKYLLKRLAERYLPHEVIYRRKQGFVMPLVPWLRGRLWPFVEAALRNRAFVEREWLQPAFIERLSSRFMAGHDELAQPLWSLLVLALWAALLDGTLQPDDSLEALLDLRGGA